MPYFLRRLPLVTSLGALGVVYGDIGTSPLYALKEAVKAGAAGGAPTPEAVTGAVSVILWALILIVALKYRYTSHPGCLGGAVPGPALRHRVYWRGVRPRASRADACRADAGWAAPTRGGAGSLVAEAPPIRLPGTVVFLTAATSGIPLPLSHFLKHNHALHERVLLVNVLTSEVPLVPPEHRAEVKIIAAGLSRVPALRFHRKA